VNDPAVASDIMNAERFSKRLASTNYTRTWHLRNFQLSSFARDEFSWYSIICRNKNKLFLRPHSVAEHDVDARSIYVRTRANSSAKVRRYVSNYVYLLA